MKKAHIHGLSSHTCCVLIYPMQYIYYIYCIYIYTVKRGFSNLKTTLCQDVPINASHDTQES